jgi:glyceraldehyde 3-phosphate dehydrogenase
MKKIGINGFGRIGRLALRVLIGKYSDQAVVPIINASPSMDTLGWAHLFEYDTTYGRFPGTVTVSDQQIIINNQPIYVHTTRNPEEIPWGDYGVETVIESTGVFRDQESMSKHLRGSVKNVVLSAPTKDDAVITVVRGINESDAQSSQFTSNASCTTNCVSPVTKVILDAFGIEKAAMTTIHAYTSDQQIQDGSHKDLRRARAAAGNIIPTSTGAAIATTKVIPELKDKFDGLAIRVPVLTGSLTDFTFITKKNTTAKEVNDALIQAAASEKLKKYLEVSNKPLVSSDIIGSESSAIVNLDLTKVIDGNLVKIFAWYDNEWGYTNRLVEQALS